jgi:hypothetical protein
MRAWVDACIRVSVRARVRTPNFEWHFVYCVSCTHEFTHAGQAQPPGAVYTLFGGETQGTCWDVIARWEHFVGASPIPPPPALQLPLNLDTDVADPDPDDLKLDADGLELDADGHWPDAAVPRGIRLSFSRAGDCHLDCKNVTVEVDVTCSELAPSRPASAVAMGSQNECDWHLVVHTSHPNVCIP